MPEDNFCEPSADASEVARRVKGIEAKMSRRVIDIINLPDWICLLVSGVFKDGAFGVSIPLSGVLVQENPAHY